MNSITSFSKAKENGGGSGQNYNSYTVHNVEWTSKADALSKTRKIWGHPFNGTQDVDGEFTVSDRWNALSRASQVSFAKWFPTGGDNVWSRWQWRRTHVEGINTDIHLTDEDSKLLDVLFSVEGITAKGDFRIKAKKLSL